MNGSEHEINDKSNLPTVFQLDFPQREEFLSQVGSFTQEQRRIFHRICDFYDPFLEYNRFVLHAGKDILFANNQIEILMRKVRGAHYGLLKFKNDQGELKPDKIIITNRDSKTFYIHLLEDEIQRLMLDDAREFLSLDEMEKMNLQIPFDFVETIYPDMLAPKFFQDVRDGEKIFTIPLKTGGAFLVTSRSLDGLVEICLSKIINALKNSTFISIVSRFMNVKISEIQNKQYVKDRAFWKNLSSAILDHKDDIVLRIKHLNHAVMQSAEILQSYFTNAEKEEEKDRAEAREKQKAIEEICLEILKKEDFLVSPGDLLTMLNPHEKKWEGFKDLFYETVVKVNQKIGLPVILYIDNMYIHRDHVYPFFRSELSMQSKELRIHYIEMMERVLRTRNRDKITVFYTRDSFKNDVVEQIKENSSILAAFLGKPKVVSEGIVHYFKNLKKVRDVNRIKDFMNNFFEDGMIRFKDEDYLLNLYLLDIFNEAYKYLSWWKRFVLKVSGKHESFVNQFNGMTENSEISGSPPGEMKASLQKVSYMRPSGTAEEKRFERKKHDNQNRVPYRKRQKSQDLSTKYNLKQRNEAWEEFQEVFHKKK